MDFLSSMEISASGLNAQRTRMSVIADNLANASTTRTDAGGPYRRKDVVFKDAGGFGKLMNGMSGRAKAGVSVEGITEDSSPFKKVFDPGHPDADKSGYVSMPNVSAPTEMVNLVSATRSYQANLAAISAAKSMAEKALEIGK
ncbi:MAG: flagellar basal body rod protein FlgC [Nitrospirota bacterium]